MFRYRRYRVFLVFAVITVLALYKFGSSSGSWRERAAKQFENAKTEKGDSSKPNWQPKPEVALETKKFDVEVPAAKSPRPQQTPPPIAPVSRPVDKQPETSREEKKPAAEPSPAGLGGVENDKTAQPEFTPLVEGGQGALEVMPLPTSMAPVYWSKQKEHHPVPTESLIKLPSGKPRRIPKIQFDFKKESPTEKAERESKLDVIRSVAKRSWDGYKEFAWLHDELKPVSNTSRDPFAGWGATLVDALDTLWIMGMKEEFVEAVEAVNKINFTTSERADIPLFETTIRYLGGLLAAYDLSDRKHKVLLDKAIELAEILYSAFDTPNRMPETYYYWRPDFAGNSHLASNRVVLAEIGSLSVEFTRLAQLTGEQKYYDAVARITDNFEEFQNNTRLPGMWPTYLDASGCKRIDFTSEVNKPLQKPIPAEEPKIHEVKGLDDFRKDPSQPLVQQAKGSPTLPKDGEQLSPGGNKYIPIERPSPLLMVPNGVNPTWVPPPEDNGPPVWPGGPDDKTSSLKRRQLDVQEKVALVGAASPTLTGDETEPIPSESSVCQKQGFAANSDAGVEEYTLGGMSDSTYEYLPKEYLLLGGQEEKYQTMYEKAMDVVKKHLIFRPMLPNNDDVLISGKLFVGPNGDPENPRGNLEPENAHLTCFAGGMFGMGAKIFNRPEDLEIAIKLTEGCVYAYNMTATGIMPEAYDAIACESKKHCEWNETEYREILDPRSEQRIEQYKESLAVYEEQMSSASSWFSAQMEAMETPAPTIGRISNEMGAFEAVPTQSPVIDVLDKRQLADLNDAPKAAASKPKKSSVADDKMAEPSVMISQNRESVMGGESEEGEGPPTKDVPTRVPNAVAPKPKKPSVASVDTPEPSAKISQNRESVMGGESEEGEGPPTKVQTEEDAPLPSKTMPAFPVIYSPKPPLTHEEFVQNRIQEERLPKGVKQINARNYILRPEAIESVWYMYRITGDPHWREAGWAMFEAVNAATAAQYGNSAIDDVTKKTPSLNDEMESFWLAETLKYFYLLFEEPGVVSLDEWVLNTEAHPFRRPK